MYLKIVNKGIMTLLQSILYQYILYYLMHFCTCRLDFAFVTMCNVWYLFWVDQQSNQVRAHCQSKL